MNQLTFFIDDKLGGVTSLNFNLIKKKPQNLRPLVIHIDNRHDKMTRAGIDYPGCDQRYFITDDHEHRMNALKRLHKLVPENPGALILNYGTEMTMLDHFPVLQTTYQLVHDDYNLNLAKKYGHLIDVFICHNTHMQKRLLEILPNKSNRIFYLPHGIELPSRYREAQAPEKPLRLLFLGRMNRSKGIFDLPQIDEILRNNKVNVEWGCIGAGPELQSLKDSWKNDKVRYFSPETNAEVMDLISSYDVFVLPTKFEGSPVSLLETMAVGLVPVISKLEGGITDIVDSSVGFTPGVNDNQTFAESIIKLDNDRNLLETLSKRCRNVIIEKFDLSKTAEKYHELFGRYEEFYTQKIIQRKRTGFRLDHPMIPSIFTKTIRKNLAFLKNTPKKG